MATADYTLVATGITDEISTLSPVILPVFGAILAIFVGLKIMKRFIKSA